MSKLIWVLILIGNPPMIICVPTSIKNIHTFLDGSKNNLLISNSFQILSFLQGK